jgi:RNA polymerase sigma factor (sigma-70 family)
LIIEIPEEFREYASMVHKIAHGYPENARCSYEDYMSVGLAALIEAKQTFDPNRGVKFSTFAYTCIKNEIEKEFQNNVNALSGCSPYFVNEVEGERERISFLNNSLVSLSETKKSLDDRFQQENWSFKPTAPLKEIIVESGLSDPEQFAQWGEMREKVVEILDSLDADEKDIVYRRVFEGDTFQAIADAKKMTWRTVNYRFCRGLEKLKDKMIEAGLDIYA